MDHRTRGFFMRATICSVVMAASYVAAPALAQDPTVAGAASIGTVGGAADWAGLWKTNIGNVWNGYTIISGGTNNHTYINTPNANGYIFFRGSNTGPLSDPDGWQSRAWIDGAGIFHAQGVETTQSISALGEISAKSGIQVIIPPDGGPVATPIAALFAWNRWAGANSYAIKAFGAMSGVRSESNGNALEAISTNETGVYGITSNPDRYGGVFIGPANGLYGQGSTYGVYSDGPLFVNSSDASKASGSDRFLIVSDRRVKKDIEDYLGGLPELEKVHPVKFKYNGLAGTETSNKEYVGVIAQELEEVAPYMVSSTHRKLRDTDNEATALKQLDSGAFTYMLVNAVKQLAAENRKLAARIAEQDGKIANILRMSRPGQAQATEAHRLTQALRCDEHP